MAMFNQQSIEFQPPETDARQDRCCFSSRMSSDKDPGGRGPYGANHTEPSRGMTSLAARMASAAMHGRLNPRPIAPMEMSGLDVSLDMHSFHNT